MKRLFVIFLALILVLSFSSCKLFDTKLFGDKDDKTVLEDPTDVPDNKTDDKEPENKTDDPATDPQDPSGEDPFEILPADEQPTEEDPNTEQGASEENQPKPTPPSGNTDPGHVHVYDQEVVTAAYSAEEYTLPGQEDEHYYYSCECGAASPTETFVHHHVFGREYASAEYRVVIDGEFEHKYYYSCVCGKYSTAKGTFTSGIEIAGEASKYYGEPVSDTPTN